MYAEILCVQLRHKATLWVKPTSTDDVCELLNDWL